MTGQHEVTFEGRERTPAQHVVNVEATIVGTLKLLERARAGDPAYADENVSCAAFWLESAAAELRALLKNSKD